MRGRTLFALGFELSFVRCNLNRKRQRIESIQAKLPQLLVPKSHWHRNDRVATVETQGRCVGTQMLPHDATVSHERLSIYNYLLMYVDSHSVGDAARHSSRIQEKLSRDKVSSGVECGLSPQYGVPTSMKAHMYDLM